MKNLGRCIRVNNKSVYVYPLYSHIHVEHLIVYELNIGNKSVNYMVQVSIPISHGNMYS